MSSLRLWLYLLADHGMTGKTKGAQMPRHQEIRIRLLKCGPCFLNTRLWWESKIFFGDLGNIRQSRFHTADYIFLGGSWIDFCSLQVKSVACQLWPSVVLHEYTGGRTDTSSDEGPLTFWNLDDMVLINLGPVPPEIQTTANRKSSEASSRLSMFIINFKLLVQIYNCHGNQWIHVELNDEKLINDIIVCLTICM